MRIDPQEQLLHLWRATVRHSFRDRSFVWSDDPGDAVLDAQQLLCLVAPASELGEFRLDRPDETRAELVDALSDLGDARAIPWRLVRALTGYMARYSDQDGLPVFPAGRYLRPAGDVEVVESFAASLSLSLAAMGFCRVLRESASRAEQARAADELEQRASLRLTAAMVGLLRSFCVTTFAEDGASGQNLIHMVRQEHRATRAVVRELHEVLIEVRAGLREISIGSVVSGDYEDRNLLFECGWTWGIAANAPEVETVQRVRQARGRAATVSNLYSTVVAVNAIGGLFSQRTRLLGLLDEDQQRLARALQLRWDLAQAYWSRLAMFGTHRWPLERLPWRTVTGDESLHHSLFVATLTINDLSGRADNALGLSYLARILADIAHRLGIVRPPYATEPEPVPMAPLPIPVSFADDGPGQVYDGTGLVPALFVAIVRVAVAAKDGEIRREMDELADLVWDRMNDACPAGFVPGDRPPVWQSVSRIVEGLSTATRALSPNARGGHAPTDFARQVFVETEQAIDAARALGRTDLDAAEADLGRARTTIDTSPARAVLYLFRALSTVEGLTTGTTLDAEPPTR